MSRYGPWKVVKTIGQGGQAQIHLVRRDDEPDGQLYALKRLLNNDRLDRFKRETEVIESIDDPAIIKIVDKDLAAGRPFFVMPYYRSGDCEKAGVLGWQIERRLDLFDEVVRATSVVHAEGLVHRDIKPANILITDDETPVLGDFGICFAYDGRLATVTGEVVGARDFIAPELARGQVATAAADIYSLGKVLYWLLSGGVILHRENHRTPQYDLMIRDHQLAVMYELLDQMVVENPERRLDTGGEALQTFRKARKTFGKVINYPSPHAPQRCRYCGLADYELLGQSSPDGTTDLREFYQHVVGNQGQSGLKLRVMTCPKCGNIQIFDLASFTPRTNPWYKKS